MQIAPGQASLSLAMLKALGSQAAAPAAKAQPASPSAEPRVSAPEGGTPARHLPRGSFVDLKA